MLHNKLQMNDGKAEAILFARKGLATEHLPKSIKINDTAINFVLMLRDLGVTLDSSLSFNQHVMNTCRSAFLELRCIGLICKYCKYLTVDAAKTIVCSLVLSRLDYCNSILSEPPKCLIHKLQSSKYSCTDYTKDAKNWTYYASSENVTLATNIQ